MVYVTHNLGVVAAVCDRVGVMYAGRARRGRARARAVLASRGIRTRAGLIDAGAVDRGASPQSRRRPARPAQAQRAAEGLPLRAALRLRRGGVLRAAAGAAAHRRGARGGMPPRRGRRAADRRSHLGVELRAARGGGGRVAARRRRALDHVRPAARGGSRCVRAAAARGRAATSRSTCARARRSRSSASRAAASRRSRAPSAACCGPLSGQLTFEGRDLAATVESRSKDVRREIQIVLQNPDASLNPRQRVHQIVGRPLELFFGLHGKARRAGVEKALEDVRLDAAFASRYPDELSGGERQRVAIARALAAQAAADALRRDPLGPRRLGADEHRRAAARAAGRAGDRLPLHLARPRGRPLALSPRRRALPRRAVRGRAAPRTSTRRRTTPTRTCCSRRCPRSTARTTISTAVRSDPGVASARPESACPFADRCPWKVGPICHEVDPPWQSHRRWAHAALPHPARRALAPRRRVRRAGRLALGRRPAE